MSIQDLFNSAGILRFGMSKSFLDPPKPMRVPSSSYQTTVTPFGPVLPTSAFIQTAETGLLANPWNPSSVLQPSALESGTTSGPGSLPRIPFNVPVMYHPVVFEHVLKDKCEGSRESPSKALRLLLSCESSSESEPESSKNSSGPPSRLSQMKEPAAAFKEQATAVTSPVSASSVPPIPIGTVSSVKIPLRVPSVRTPRIERINRKREELEKVQQFLEESRAVHEKIYSNFDPRRISTRGPMSASKRRSFSDVDQATNLAELRRNISDKYASSNKREPSPMPPLPSAPAFEARNRGFPVLNTAESRQSSRDDKQNSSVRTPSASAKSPKPASPDRIVSGVFVSYPRARKRSMSTPHSDIENNQKSPVEESGSVISSLRPQGNKAGVKMTAEEYAQLRQNLLSRSEQHAVTSGTGSSLS